MKKSRWMWTLVFVLLMAGCFAACGKKEETVTFRQVDAKQAKEMMDTEEDYIILDVRTEEEYESGHIKGALLIPDYELEECAQQEMEKDQLILVYCRSGNRSKKSAQLLAEMGYTNVVEFGGIIDWPYEIEQ